jgi:hypothetical protein
MLEEQSLKVSLTTDIWSSCAQTSYLGVTFHYLTKDFHVKGVTPDMRLLKTSHTGMNIADILEEILSDWHVDPTAIVTDNASSMCLCGRQFPLHVPCAGHTLQLAINSGLKIHAVESVLEKCRKLVTHFKRSTKELRLFVKFKSKMG